MRTQPIMHVLFRTLRGRLILSVALVHAVLMSLFVIDVVRRQHALLVENQFEEATAMSQSLAASSAGWIAANDVAGLQELVEAQRRYPEVVFALLSDSRGRVLAHTDRGKRGLFLTDLPAVVQETRLPVSSGVVDIAVPAMLGTQHVGWARVGIGESAASVRLMDLARIGLWYALGAIVIGSVVAWVMGHQVTRKLYRLQETIREVRSGGSKARSPAAGTDEVSIIAREFNAMLDSLDDHEAALRRSEDESRSLLLNVHAAVVVHGPDGRIVKANPMAELLLGISAADLMGRKVEDPGWHFIREDGSRVPVSEYPVNRILTDLLPIRNKVIGIQRGGGSDVVWVLVNADRVADDRGATREVIIAFMDITDRKRAEDTLENRSREVHDLYNRAPCGYHSLGEDGTFLQINDTELEWLGYRREEVVGVKRFSDVLKDPGRDLFAESFPVFIRQGWIKDLEFELVRKNGSSLNVLLSGVAVYGQSGKYVMSRSTVYDITERRRAEQQLRERERHTQALLRLSRRLEGTREYQEAMDAAQAAAAEVLGFKNLWVYLFDPDGEHATALFARGWLADTILTSTDVAVLTIRGDPMLEEIAASPEIVVVEDARSDPRTNKDIVAQLGNRTIVNVPIVLLEKYMGSVGLGTFGDEGVRVPTAVEREFLIGLASHLAVAMDRIRLLREQKTAASVLQIMNRELRAISRCNKTLLRAMDEETLLKDVCRIVCDEAGYRMAWVGYAVMDELKSVRPVASAGVDDGYLAAADITWADGERGHGPCGAAIRTGVNVCVQDFSSDPHVAPWREAALARGYQSSLALPLRDVEGSTFGAFTIFSGRPGAFTDDEVRLLEDLAADLAYGIAALRGQIDRRKAEIDLRRELEINKAMSGLAEHLVAESGSVRSFAEVTLKYALALTQSEHGFVSTIDPRTGDNIGHTLTAMMQGSCKLSDEDRRITFAMDANGHYGGLWGHALNTRMAFYSNAPGEHPASRGTPAGHIPLTRFLAAPALFGARLVGEVALSNAHRDYSDDDIEMISRVSTMFAIAVARFDAEQALVASEKRFSAAFHLSPVGCAISRSADDVITDVNDVFGEMLGRRKEEIIGHTPAELSIYSDPGELTKMATELAAHGAIENFELRLTPRSGSERTVLTSARLIEIGGEAHYLGSLLDITERKQAEKELAARDAELRTMAQSSPGLVGTFYLRPDGTMCMPYASPQIEHLFGLRPEDVVNDATPLLNRTHPDDATRVIESIRESGHTMTPWRCEYRVIHPERGELWLEGTTNPRPHPEGGVIWYGFVHDISRRKYAEEEILRLNQDLERRVTHRTSELESANRELEAFAYSVSHDLRAPLRAIDGFSQLLLDDHAGRLDAVGKDYLTRVRMGAQRMGQLIDDLLSLSRVNRSEMAIQTVDLSVIAARIGEDLRRSEPGRHVTLSIQKDVVVRGDGRLLAIVLENLLGNAWKYTSRHQTAQIVFGVEQRKGVREYFVQDDGAGFEMRYVDKLFGAFQRLHNVGDFPGTGIGLATVQRIIHRHGGTVSAEGAVEKGARIAFTLP
jgi:PAS domain S-box-containing protein